VSERIPADTGTGGSVFLWLFSLVWLGLMAIGAAMDPGAVGSVLCFSVPGLIALALAVRTTRTRMRYGGAELELMAPAQVGGRLEGIVHLPQAAGVEDRIRATLTCKKPGGTEKADPVLWRGFVFGAPVEPSESGHSRFPVKIEIPETCFASGRERAYWILNVNAEQGLTALDIWFHLFVEGPGS
jgi:hypothetical protein